MNWRGQACRGRVWLGVVWQGKARAGSLVIGLPAFAIALLLAATPATAACHHYSTWKYPYPQPKCGVQEATREAPLPPEAPKRIYLGPSSLPPPPEEWNEDAQRAFAIQKLREQLERK